MPRKLRLEYVGAIYHVMNRGDRREDIFLDDEDRCRFVQTLAEACEKTDWQVHAYPQYLKAAARRATWLRAERLLGECGRRRR